MSKKILLLAVSLLFVTLTFAIGIGGNKYLEGKILLEDGTIIKGFVQVPKSPRKKTIAYKEHKEGRKITLESEKVKSFVVTTKTDKTYRFDNLKIDARRKADKSNITKRKVFLMALTDGYASLYMASDGYKTHKSGSVLVTARYEAGKNLPTYTYFIKKQTEDIAVAFTQTSSSSTMFGLNKMLIHRAEMLLADDPALINRIKSKEFKHIDVIELINIYNKDMVEKN